MRENVINLKVCTFVFLIKLCVMKSLLCNFLHFRLFLPMEMLSKQLLGLEKVLQGQFSVTVYNF